MTAIDLEVGPDALKLQWADGTNSIFPYIWLRDNCPSGLHLSTQERTFDLLSLASDPRAGQARIAEDMLVVEWSGEDHVSRFPLDWLARRQADPASIPATRWRGDPGAGNIPRHAAGRIMADDAALGAWLVDTAAYGLSIVDGVAGTPEAGVQVVERIGFLRRTNFGTTFEVVNKPEPNNLAYTADRLPLHTDLPNQEVPPGYQFLHCIANEAQGGESMFADGYAIARDLQADEPEAFRLLVETPIPFRFHDAEVDIRTHAPVIRLDRKGEPVEIRFNSHLAAVFDMPAEVMDAYYRAYRAFMGRTREARYVVRLKLKPGEMVAFDNRRVLHGRERFDPNTGFRHLHGCYVDRGEFDSRLRVLARHRDRKPAMKTALGADSTETG